MGSAFTDFYDFTGFADLVDFFFTRRDMGSAFTGSTDFTDLFKPFFARRNVESGFTGLTDFTDFTVSSDFFLPDEISLGNRGDPPCPI